MKQRQRIKIWFVDYMKEDNLLGSKRHPDHKIESNRNEHTRERQERVAPKLDGFFKTLILNLIAYSKAIEYVKSEEQSSTTTKCQWS